MRGVWRRFLELVAPARLDREALEEMSHHVDLLVERNRASGLDEREARRQAVAEVGSVDAAGELIRESRTGFNAGQFAREFRYAARVLKRSPGITLLSVVTMGVGIGASAILFALVDGIVLRPLPYPEPDRLVRIFDTNPEANIERTGAASGNIVDWRRRARGFEEISGYYVMGRTVTFGSDTDVLLTAQVSSGFFDLFRVPAALGRSFTVEESERALFNSAAAPIGGDPVVMLSHTIWTQRFGGASDVIGRNIVLDRRPFRIVGVMPPGFGMPQAGVQLWIPWALAGDHARDQHYVGAVARIATGVALPQAEEMLNAVARELALDYPRTNRGWGVRLSPLADETVGATASILWVLLAAVGLLLLIGCANVALLSLMRGLDRREEVAVRMALGASSGRLLREFAAESLALATMGGVLGGVIAGLGLRVLPAIAADLPRLDEVSLDYRALAFIVGVTLVSAFVTALPQAWRNTRRRPIEGLGGSTLRTTERRTAHSLRDAIVVCHVTLAMMLMTGAGLLVESFSRLRRAESGFDPRGVLVAPIFLDNQEYDSGEKTRAYYREVLEGLSRLPGVVAVGAATTVPTSPLGPDFERPVWPAGSESDPAQRIAASVRMVTPGYFNAMGLRVVGGRAIDDRDSPQASRVLMVSETLAQRMWPGGSAVGRRLMVDYSTAGVYPYEIVGVVGDLRFRGPRSEPLAEIYLPHAQRSYLVMNVVVKTAENPRALIPSVRSVLKSVDPQKPAHGLYPLEDLVSATYARDRQAAVALVLFATAAVLLAMLSVSGALAQRVRERTRELGIRMALGADAMNLVGWVVRSGVRLIGLGLLCGAAAGWALGGALDGVLYGVAGRNAATTLAATGTLAVVGTIGALIPSWRATRIDPVHVLRRG
jgi:predicted permease